MAKAAGYRSLPAPPTFAFCLEMETNSLWDNIAAMGVPVGKILHASQTFTYHAPICAGDRVTFQTKVSDIYDKKGGALEFIVEDTTAKTRTASSSPICNGLLSPATEERNIFAMAQPNYEDISVGDQPIRLETDPISRTTLALYAGASGDHNPMHIDIDYAKAAGETDVFAHGMLIMAYLGRSVTSWVPQSAVRSFNTRFTAITRVGEKDHRNGKSG